MKKENLIGVAIVAGGMLLLLILIFIWLLTRQNQNSNSVFGPTPTLSVLQKAKLTPYSPSNPTRSSTGNNNATGNTQTNTTNSDSTASSLSQEGLSTSPERNSIHIMGNKYREKNYSEYFSGDIKKNDTAIKNSLAQQFPNITEAGFVSESQTSSLSLQSSKQVNLIMKLLNTFFSIPQIDPSIYDIALPSIYPTPLLNNQSLPPLTPGLLSGKIGIYILSDYSPGAKQIVASKPRVLKVMDPQANNTLQAVKDFKGINPQGITVLRAYIGTSGVKFDLQNDPGTAAESFFQAVVQPALSALGENKKLFDFIETPNELDNTPGWESTVNTAWLNTFWIKLTELYASNGLRTCVASIPVGNPPGDYSQVKAELTPFLPALQKVKELGGAFCYHAYTLNYSTDTAQELQTSLRYRQIHQVISELDSSLSSLPFILSEAGVDKNGDPKSSGWIARGSENDYKNWLSWFNGQINQDSYVLGATLYQIGDNHWSSFNIESISDWISKSL